MLVVLGVLLLLDAGRSIYARTAYAEPATRWEPDPSVYANLTWPPGADLPASTPTGPRIYARHCATCHGPDGRGNGPATAAMFPHPTDFVRGEFKFKSTAAGRPPTDADLVGVVRDGLHASAMPYFRDVLSDDEIRAVVSHVKSVSPVFDGPEPPALTVPARPPADAAGVARGKKLYATHDCGDCHGTDGRARRSLRDRKGYPVLATDLTAPWTFRGGAEPEQIWLRLSTGLGPMPAIAGRTTPAERWDLVSYVASLRRVAPWEPGGKLDGPGHDPDLRKRGEYLVRSSTCSLCHTQINSTGIYRVDDAYLAGGQRVGAYPHAYWVSSNLTSDRHAGIGSWSVEELVDGIRDGRGHGRTLNPWGMQWAWFHRLTDDDARAMGTYLKTVPAVNNPTPVPLRYGFVETLLAKLTRPLPAADPVRVDFGDGNYGLGAVGGSRGGLQRWLVAAQLAVLIAGILAFIAATPRTTSLWRIGLGTGLAVVLGLGAWFVYAWPAVPVPPDLIADNALEGTPALDPTLPPERARLAARGQYLYTTTTCGMCHENDGSGGKKISWKPFGTLRVSNITSDPETGVGSWTDQELARAIRSGVSRDGRMLHWQAMTWDYASNLDEEDIRALVAYLRTLPPVKHEVPAFRPPAADDCEIYTFWTSAGPTPPGCANP